MGQWSVSVALRPPEIQSVSICSSKRFSGRKEGRLSNVEDAETLRSDVPKSALSDVPFTGTAVPTTVAWVALGVENCGR